VVGGALGPANSLAGEGGHIPYRLWIGVTGHRSVPDDPALREQIRSVLDQIRELTPNSGSTATYWGVISPLAEGADQLVAREVLNDENAALETPLPFAVDEYMKDFTGEGPQFQFRELIERASLVTVLPETRSRDAAYAQIGEYVVDHCDVLVALWDGEGARGQGGTAEVVELARSRGVPLFWIFSKADYEVQKELGPGVSRQAFEEVDAYNRARISDTRFKKNVERQDRRWSQAATFAGLPAHHLRPYLRWIVRYMIRADILAEVYQSYYFGLGTALFALAALAVAAAAVQILAPTRLEPLALLESFFMLLALAMIALAQSMRVHHRWISYRALAERFRLAFFLSVAGIGAERSASADPPHRMRPYDWTSRSFNEVWVARPRDGRPPFSLDALKRFLNEAWIDDQINYYKRAATRNHRREQLLSWTVGTLFACTLIVAGVHGLGPLMHRAVAGPEWLIVLAIVLPAAAASLGGIQAQHEYETNAIRFTQMAQRLSVIRRRMESAADVATLEAVVESAAHAMLEEHRGWFGMMRAHALSLRELF
jgi:SMODS and SLOG-associating 2TM effector domain 1